MIEIWQNNTVFYNSVPKQKYGTRKLNSASSPPCQSQPFSIKGQIIVFCLPPSQLTATVTALCWLPWHWKIFVLTRPQITRWQVLKLNIHSMCICYVLVKSLICWSLPSAFFYYYGIDSNYNKVVLLWCRGGERGGLQERVRPWQRRCGFARRRCNKSGGVFVTELNPTCLVPWSTCGFL